MSEGRLRAFILALAVVLQAALFVAHSSAGWADLGDEVRYRSDARALAAGQAPPADFVWPPLQAHLLALVQRLFGEGRLALAIVQAGMLLTAGLCLELLARAAGLSPRAGLAALALFLLDPQVAGFAQYLWPEVPHLLFALGGAALLLAGGRPGPGRLALAGAAFGLALLTKSLLAGFLPVLAAAAAMGSPARSVRTRLVAAAAFLLGVAAPTVPVILHNGLTHGTYAISKSGTFNLWVGISEPGDGDYDAYVWDEMQRFRASAPTPEGRDAVLRQRLRELVAREGPVSLLAAQLAKQPRRLLAKDSYLTDRLPGGRFTGGEARPIDRFLRLAAYSAYAVVLLLGALGLCLARWREDVRALSVPALFLVYNAGLFLFLHVKTRYRIGFLPALVFFGALALDRLGDSAAPATRGRVLAGAVLGAAALALAFAGS